MGALDNAVNILADPLWRQYMAAASAYVARVVYSEDPSTEDHDVRRRLALDILSTPDLVADKLAVLLGSDPALITSTSVPADVDENLIIQKVTGYWTILAKNHAGQI